MIEIAMIVALSVLFLHVMTLEGMILSFIRPLLYSQLPSAISKPLFDCAICMTPWYGSLIIWLGFLYDEWQLPNLFEWLLILAVASGLNIIFSSFIHEDE